jgi:hypothetical protein
MRKSLVLLGPLLLTGITACGGGGDSSGGSGDPSGEEITVAYVENKINNDWGTPGSYTANGTVLVHDDGYQGNSIDVGRVILSKINSSATGETLAVGFSHKLASAPANGTFAAFYIDTDNDPATGKTVTGSDDVSIGADVLFLDQHAFDTDGSSHIISSYFYTWAGSWVPQTASYGTGSYYEGFSISRALFASNSNGVPDLLGVTEAKGVFTAQLMPDGDPNAVSSTIDTTESFSFDFPS